MKLIPVGNERRIYAYLGFALGFGAPIGWLLLRILTNQWAWVQTELLTFGPLYGYLTVATVLAFTLFGYLLGWHSDLIEQESEVAKSALEKVHILAETDALTGLRNQRYLHDHVTVELESAERYGTAVTCLMADIDNFKQINDAYGHPVGDAVLVRLAKILQEQVRCVDVVGRLGGEEFLIIMPHTSSATAFSIAERIRLAVEHPAFAIEDLEIPVTVSIGAASFPSVDVRDKAGFMRAVDEALYQAKRTGRNRVVVHRHESVAA